MPDYVAMRLEEKKDAKQYGVKGQQWGVRRSSRALAAAAKVNPPAKQAEKKTESSAPAQKQTNNIQNHVESSSDRYDRLSGQAKAGRAHEMTEQDLKFFNARTEALGKVAKLNEVKPSWLQETTTRVVQQAAQRQMQAVVDAAADKFISDPIKAALKGVGGDTPSAKAAAAVVAKTKTSTDTKADTAPAKTVVEVAKKAVETAASSAKSTPAADPSSMRFVDAIKYFKDNPDATPTVPKGYSPNAAKVFLDEVAKARKS